MAVNIFEWKIENADSEQDRVIYVKAGHLAIEIDSSLKFHDEHCFYIVVWSVLIKWGNNTKYFELAQDYDDAVEAIKYIAIGLNAEIEAQGTALPNSAGVETIKQSDYIKGFKQYVLILVSLVVVSAWAVGFLMNLAK